MAKGDSDTQTDSKPESSESTPKPDTKKDKPEISSKKCPLCDEVLTADDHRKLSSKMAEHLSKIHPEDEDEEEIIKKKTFKLKCVTCGHEAESDTQEELDRLMQAHSLSHENESQLDTKDKTEKKGSLIYVAVGLAMITIGAIMAFGFLYSNNQKKGLSKGKK